MSPVYWKALPVVIAISLFSMAVAELAEADTPLGERIYRHNLGGLGNYLSAFAQRDTRLYGERAACEQCHRRSGLGSSEGGIYVPPINGLTIFNPRTPQRARMFKRLFKEYQPNTFWSRVRAPRARPAYTTASLAKLLRTGVDPSGRELSPSMPRYDVTDIEVEALATYLNSLSDTYDEGVDKEAIYFATVMTDTVDPARKKALTTTIEKFVAWMNEDTRGDLSKPTFSPYYRTDFKNAYKRWEWEVWTLKGDSASWPKQLQTYYNRQPVFALVSGLVDQPWTAVGDFCNQNRVPCLFPNTQLPEQNEPKDGYSFFFNRGLYLEAAVIGQYIKGVLDKSTGRQPQIVIARNEAPESQQPAHALRQYLDDNDISHATFLDYVDVPTLERQLGRLTEASETILVHFPAFDETQRPGVSVYDRYAQTILPCHVLEDYRKAGAKNQKLVFSYPYENPGAYHPRRFRIRAWMNSRRLPIIHEQLQYNTYYALTVLQYGLDHMVDAFYRDYLVEYIEHEAENALNPGTFPRLALGPGQHYASKGAFMVRLAADSENDLVTLTPWIVP